MTKSFDCGRARAREGGGDKGKERGEGGAHHAPLYRARGGPEVGWAVAGYRWSSRVLGIRVEGRALTDGTRLVGNGAFKAHDFVRGRGGNRGIRWSCVACQWRTSWLCARKKKGQGRLMGGSHLSAGRKKRRGSELARRNGPRSSVEGEEREWVKRRIRPKAFFGFLMHF